MRRAPRRRVLVVGGFEPTGAVGVVADAWAVRESGCEPVCVITSLAVQMGARRVRALPLTDVKAQLASAFRSGPIHAVKSGVIPDARILGAVAAAVSRHPVPWVLDPVTRSSRGVRLSRLSNDDLYGLDLSRVVLTPNRAELKWFELGVAALAGISAGVIVKSIEPGADLVMIDVENYILLRGTPIRRAARHRGTGCRFASALAASLARGHTLVPAARHARRLTRNYLRGV